MSVSRRNFIAGATAAGALGGLGATLVPNPARAAADAESRNLIIVFAKGGWDTSYALDPKPGLPSVDAPVGEITMFENLPIFTDVSRPEVTTFFEAYAGVSAVINGINVRSIAHDECRKRLLTGTPSSTNPDLGAIAGHQLGRELPVPYLVLGDTAFTGPLAVSSGRVGNTNQIVALLSPQQAYPQTPGSPYVHSGFAASSEEEALIRQFVAARAQRECATRGALGYNKSRIDDFVESLGRGDLLRANVDGFGDRGVTLGLDQQIDLAIRAINEDIAHTISIDTRQPWDTHQNNALQQQFHETLFASLTLLADTLMATPGRRSGNTMMDETVVAVLSELSRTPLLNGDAGKDHHPVTSALIFGAGVNGGRAFGGTNDLIEGLGTNLQTGDVDADAVPLQTGSVVAGITRLVGADSGEYITNVEPLDAICA